MSNKQLDADSLSPLGRAEVCVSPLFMKLVCKFSCYSSVSQTLRRDPNAGSQDFIDGSLTKKGHPVVLDIPFARH